MTRNPANWRWCRIRRCTWKPGWILDYVTTDGKRRQLFAGPTAEDALALKTKLIREGRIRAHAPDTPLLARYAEAWLERRADGNVAASTLHRDRIRLRARILPALGHLPLADITHDALLDYRGKALRAGSPANWNRDRALLSALLSDAVASGILAVHPIKGRIPAATELPPDRRVLTELEQLRLLDALARLDADSKGDPWAYPYYLIALDTAARPGAQISTLEWRDVDLESGTLTFRRPKGGRRRNARDLQVVLTPRLHDALRARWLARQSDIYIFPGYPRAASCEAHPGRAKQDRPLTNHIKRFKAAVGLAGLPRDVIPYTCRHTALTNLAAAGLPTKDIKAIAGHGRIATTERYLHADRSTAARAAAILGQIASSRAQERPLTGISNENS